MMNTKKRFLSLAVVVTLMGTSMMTMVPSAEAASRNYRDYYNNYQNRYQNGGSFGDNHPYLQKTLIGSGLGAVVGGVLTRNSDWTNGAIKGAVLGGAAGAGYEYLKRNRL